MDAVRAADLDRQNFLKRVVAIPSAAGYSLSASSTKTGIPNKFPRQIHNLVGINLESKIQILNIL